MKLLFVLENYHPHVGGVEVLFKHLCEGLAKNHDVTVVTRRLPGTKQREVISGVRVLRVWSANSRYVFTFTAIRQVLRQAKRADIIHTTTYNAAFPSWIARIISRKPAIITVHETWIGNWNEFSDFSLPKRLIHDLLERLLYAITRFDRYVCVSDSTKAMLTATVPRYKKRIVRVHNGFDPTPWEKQQTEEVAEIRNDLLLDERFSILAAGRPGTSKGFSYLIESMPLIKKEIPNAVLLLILSTDKQYRHRIKTFKKIAHEDVMFLRPQSYELLPAFRQAVDCNVIPSLAEGFGFAVLESCAAGKPVVATNTTSIPEVIYGKHVLVKTKSAKALAKGIIDVYKKQYAHTKPKRFPWSDTITGYENVYKELT